MNKIIHIDMDAFFASVEIRDNPNLKDKPVVVGNAGYRSVVCAANYVARKYGIHSALPMSEVKKRHPKTVIIPPDFAKYRLISKIFHNIIRKYSDKFEPLSLDEVYVDVTKNKINEPSATKIALMIQRDVKEQLNLTCSCGISYNKFLAKIASDFNKPNGYYVITPEQALPFLEQLSIRDFFGIGKKTAQQLITMGIYTGKDLKALSREELQKYFNVRGDYFYNVVRGIDEREVKAHREPKSISNERTLRKDTKDKKIIQDELLFHLDTSYQRLHLQKFQAKTIVIRFKYFDFKQTTKSISFSDYTDDKELFKETIIEYLNELIIENDVRLVGIGFQNLQKNDTLNKNKFKSKYKQTHLQI